jgi:hypothetical protein
MPNEREPSAYAVGFGEKRLAEIFAALGRLSPALSAAVEKEAGSGSLFERMGRASAAIGRIGEEVASGGGEEKVRKELSESMGKSYSPAYVRAVLAAHSQGLAHLATPEGLGGALFLHFASVFRAGVEKHAAASKAEPGVAASALSLVDAWVRSLLLQSSPEDPDDPILALASSPDAEYASKWSVKLFLRCTTLTEDDRVIDLILGSFRAKS